MNFNSIMIGSEDPKRLVDYYTKILGKPAMSEGGYDGWQIGSGWITIGAHDEVKGKNPTPGRLILNIESEDVKGDFEKFRAAGAKVVREPYNVGEESPYWIAQSVEREPASTTTGGHVASQAGVVATHVRNIMNKLGFNSRAQVAGWMVSQER